MPDLLIHTRDGPVTRLTLNRPQKANTLSAELVEALLAGVANAYADGTRMLVLDGNGPHFCAGFDFTGHEESSDASLALRFIRIETLLQNIYHAPFATLALAHGKNFGAGADLIAACHKRIAAPGASFRLPGLLFGVVLGTRRLANVLGTDKARDVLSAARTFSADEGLQAGLLTRLAPPDEWPKIVTAHEKNSELLSPDAAAALYRLTESDTRAEDMAELARSVSVPGLKERIRHFRNGLLA